MESTHGRPTSVSLRTDFWSALAPTRPYRCSCSACVISQVPSQPFETHFDVLTLCFFSLTRDRVDKSLPPPTRSQVSE
jgi:hypothetical protein